MNVEDSILLVNTATESRCHYSMFSKSPETTTIPIRINTASHKFCIICRSDLDGKHATVISESIRLTLLVEHTVYLKPGVHCCKNHLNDRELKPEGLIMI